MPVENNNSTFSIPAPEPLFREMAEANQFPIDKLGAALGPAVKALMEHVRAPDAVCAQSVLAAASLAAQGLRDVEIDGRRFPISENFITIAISGERKSAIDKLALKAHYEFERQELEKYHSELARFKVAEELYNKAKASSFRQKEKPLTLNEMQEAAKNLGDPPRAPLSKIMMVEEPTFEGLTKLLEINQPSIGIFTDEAGRLIGGHAMNRDNSLKTMAGFSNLWDGRPVSRSRSGDGTSKLYGRRLSIHMMVQPQIAQLLISNPQAREQGFLSRCLISWPKSTVGSRSYQSTNLNVHPDMLAYWNSMEKLLEIPKPRSSHFENQLNPACLRLSEEAHSRWVHFHNKIESDSAPDGAYGTITDFASKAPEHALRIAGILTVVENSDLLEISDDCMRSAIAITEYYLSENVRIVGTGHLDQHLIEAKMLYDWLISKKLRVFYPALIYQKGPRSIRDKKRARSLIQILENHGYLLKAPPMKLEEQFRKEVWTVIV